MTPESEPTPISYEQLSELLQPLGILINPTELQGLLCGKLCGGANPDETDWLLEAVEELDFTQPPDETVRDALTQVFRDTRSQLTRDGFALQPLLPTDAAPITARVLCLGQWCHGFLVGFGTAGRAGDSDLSEEAKEALEDMAAIAQVQLDEEESARAAEADYTEVVEYVRMAALSLFMEYGAEQLLRSETDEAQNDEEPPTVH